MLTASAADGTNVNRRASALSVIVPDAAGDNTIEPGVDGRPIGSLNWTTIRALTGTSSEPSSGAIAVTVGLIASASDPVTKKIVAKPPLLPARSRTLLDVT